MVIREWRTRAAEGRLKEYAAHFHSEVIPELRSCNGFLGAQLCQRGISEKIEFLVLTRWQSLEAVKEFAGKLLERAVVDPAAAAVLIDYDETVQHYEILEMLEINSSD